MEWINGLRVRAVFLHVNHLSTDQAANLYIYPLFTAIAKVLSEFWQQHCT